jgi:hypothetical protein
VKKIIIYLFGFFLLIQTNALACNFKIANFGSPKENIKLDNNLPEPLLMPDRFGGENLVIPIEQICKSNNKLYGTQLIYLYIDNKLSRIQLYRPIMPDRNLMDFAMEKYGSFNLPKGLSKEKWRGNHVWDLNLELVEYIVTDIHDGHVEIIDIVNKLYLPTIESYNEKVGEWLDSGQ